MKIAAVWLLQLLLLFVQPSRARQLQVETADEFHERMQNDFQTLFDILSTGAADALWVGFADPVHGDLYWVFGNATSSDDSIYPPDIAATLDQTIEIGSISKTFGATANLLLAEQGVFGLDDTVAQLTPNLAQQYPIYANFTVRELMGMRTDVPDFFASPNQPNFLSIVTEDPDVRFTLPELMDLVLPNYPANLTNPDACPEGCKGGYSSTNIIFLEYMVEQLTNRSYPEILEELVLTPLGLDDTGLPERFSDGVRPEPAATGYVTPRCQEEIAESGVDVDVGTDMTPIGRSLASVGTAGSMYSKISDLLQWAKSGTGDDLLMEETQAARKEFTLLVSGGENYGLGQLEFAGVEEDYPFLIDWYGHTGDSLGFVTYAFRNDELDASFAAAVNTCHFNTYELVVLQKLVEELNSRNLTEGPADEDPTPAPTTAATSAGANKGSMPNLLINTLTLACLIWMPSFVW